MKFENIEALERALSDSSVTTPLKILEDNIVELFPPQVASMTKNSHAVFTDWCRERGLGVHLDSDVYSAWKLI